MGAFLSGLRGLLVTTQPRRILLVGLDAAGKTTILYKLKLAETVTTIPTIGFNVETVKYKNLQFTMWDVGGQERIRPLWGHYYEGVDAIIFVVDSADRDRLEEAADELNKMLKEDQLDGSSLLVFANKQDLPHATPVTEMVERLGLTKLKGRTWYVQSCVATTGKGLYEGLDWMSKAVLQKQAY